jgi:hypothetical protein
LKRTDFIKKIIGLFGVAVLPPAIFKQYRKLYLLQCFIRGFRFYDGPTLLGEMKQGDLLELVKRKLATYRLSKMKYLAVC